MIISSSGGDFKPVEPGVHVATCIRLIDLGTQPSGPFSPKRRVLLVFELPEELVKMEDGQEMPALIFSRYTATLHEKGLLRPALESWRGRKFTADELSGFDLGNVLGKPCMINVVHSDDGKYANIAAIMPLPKGSKAPPPVHPLINFSLDEFDETVFESLGTKVQDAIKASPEYAQRTGTFAETYGTSSGSSFVEDDMDSIPF